MTSKEKHHLVTPIEGVSVEWNWSGLCFLTSLLGLSGTLAQERALVHPDDGIKPSLPAVAGPGLTWAEQAC